MLELPSSFVISSRLSTLDAKDVLGILHFAGKKWNERQVLARMRRYPATPVMGVGISNPQELHRVICGDIPVIHIQKDCEALQAVQKRDIRHQRLYHGFAMINAASVWGLFIQKMMKGGIFERGQDVVQVAVFETGNIPIPNYVIGICTLSMTVILAWISKRVHHKMVHEYAYYMEDKQMILIRKDVLYSKGRLFLQTVIPYCFIGLSVYHYKNSVAHK